MRCVWEEGGGGMTTDVRGGGGGEGWQGRGGRAYGAVGVASETRWVSVPGVGGGVGWGPR